MSAIERLFSARLTQPYQPTLSACRWWYGELSREVFGLTLPSCGFVLIHCPESWAYYDPTQPAIELAGQFATKQQFVAVLGHEMVHHWQRTVLNVRPGHGKTFRAWRKTFVAHGMQLESHGNVHLPTRSLAAATRCNCCLVAAKKDPVAGNHRA